MPPSRDPPHHIRELASDAWFEFRAAQNANINEASMTMQDAIAQNNLTRVRACLEDNAFDVNGIVKSDDTLTALMYASELGHVKIVEELLNADGVEVNLACGYQIGLTALMLACRNGHEAVVRALLRAPKIDLERKGPYGTALALAAEHHNVPIIIVRNLLCAGASADAEWFTIDIDKLDLIKSWKDMSEDQRRIECWKDMSEDQRRNAIAYGWEHRDLKPWTHNTHNTFPDSFRKQSAAVTMATRPFDMPQDVSQLVASMMQYHNIHDTEY